MSYSSVPVEQFGGLNVVDDPGTVGWSGAVDLLNVDFDLRGRVRSRDGYDNWTPLAGAARYSTLFQSSPSVLLAGRSGGTVEALGAGLSVAISANTYKGVDFANIGTASARYTYIAGGNTIATKRWEGYGTNTFSAPAGMPNALTLAASPIDNRLMAGNTGTSETSRVKWSDPGAPETWGANNYVDFTPGDGEQIASVVSWRELVFIFKQSKFFVHYGVSTDSSGNPIFNYRSVDAGHGASDADYHVAAGPDAVYFVDRRPNFAGLFRTTGGTPERVPSPLDYLYNGRAAPPFLATSFTINSSIGIGKTLAISGNRLYIAINTDTSGGGTGDDKLFVTDIGSGVWTLWDVPARVATGGLTGFEDQGTGGSLYFSYGTGGNHIGYFKNTFTTDDGSAITSRYRSGFADLGSRDEKRLAQYDLWGTGAPTLKVSADFGSLSSGSTATMGTSPAIARKSVTDQARDGTYFSWQVGGTSAWALHNMTGYSSSKRPPGTH